MREVLRGARSLYLETTLVLGTGALLGVFLWNTVLGRAPHLFGLGFEQGRWITTLEESPNAYFRKELFIPQRVKDAWVTVASGESTFHLLVNGRTAERLSNPERSAGGVYDIAPFLIIGKNVVALEVRSAAVDQPARAAVEGGYRDSRGNGDVFCSDGSWTASSHFEAQADLSIPWYDPRFVPQIPEARAKVLGTPSPDELPRVPVHPSMFALPSPTYWMVPRGPGASSAVFSSRFEVDAKVRGAWVRIAAPDGYALALNGIPIFERQVPSPTFEIHDVTPYLTEGGNTIDVRVAASAASPRVALDLVAAVRGGGTRTVVASGPTWTVRGSRPYDRGGSAEAGGEPVALWGGASWPVNPKTFVTDSPPARQLTRRIVWAALFGLGVLLVALLDWVLMGLLICRLAPYVRWQEALHYDGILRLPTLLFLGAVYLLGYDVRLDPAFPFQGKWMLVSLALLFLLRAVLMIALRLQGPRAESTSHLESMRVAPQRGRALILFCLVAVVASGTALRLNTMLLRSLDHDEISMVRYAQEIWSHGYPLRQIGPLDKPLTTYELLPYPIALSIALFGSTEFAARLPALVFAGLTTLLLYYAGARTWGPGTGLLAAAIHAFCPFSIYWGSDAFHPQQAQFLALLTAYLFYRAVGQEPGVIHAVPLYLATLAFAADYLTWEGSGLLLPALFVCLLVQRGRDFGWLRNAHVWIAGSLAGVVVAIQLARRTLATVSYISVGSSLAGSALGQGFLRISYDPWYYLNSFLLQGHHLVLTVALLLGLPLVFQERAIRYYVTLLVFLLVALTNLLAPQSARYAYFLQPFLLLPASAVVTGLAGSSRLRAGALRWRPLRTATSLSLAGAVGLVLLSTNSLVLKLHRLGAHPEWVSPSVAPEWGGLDYRSASRLVQERILPGDVVIALMPHALEYYSDVRPDYYLQSYTNRILYYDMNTAHPRYMDRFVGTSVLRNVGELMDVLHRHRRAWILATPYSSFVRSNDRDTLDYVSQHARVVAESSGMVVYLWER